MKALTIQQPWAWAIAWGYKTVENRSRPVSSYRGQLAVHAGKKLDPAGDTDPRIVAARGWLGGTNEADDSYAVRGAIVAVADLVDCHPAVGCCRPWGQTDGHHLILRDITRLRRPVPYTGHLGLRDVPDTILDQIRHQTGRTTS